MSVPSTSSSAGATANDKRGALPGWLAALLILMALAVGGWILWSFWQSLQTAGTGAVVVLDEKPSERGMVDVQARGQMIQRQRLDRQLQLRKAEIEGADYVRVRPNGQPGWVIKGNRTRVIVTKSVTGQYRFNADSLDPEFTTPEQRQALSAAFRAVSDDTLRKQLNITDDQKTKLTALPRSTNYPMDAAMRKNLETLFTAWEKAPDAEKAAKADALIKATREIEAALAEKTKKAIADSVAQMKTILTPEQLKGLGG